MNARSFDPNETARAHLRNALMVLRELNDVLQADIAGQKPIDLRLVVNTLGDVQARVVESLGQIEAGKL